MGRIKEFWGLFVFLVSVCIALQLIWVVEHQRPDETLRRLVPAVVLGFAFSFFLVQALLRFGTAPIRSAGRTVSDALWPGFLLVFTPFHVLLYCRWRGQCGYAGDFFILQFLVFFVLILVAGPLQSATGALRSKCANITSGSLIRLVVEHQYAAAVCLALALLLWRGWGRFIHPEFFAEGGTVFLKDALMYGWSSIFYTYAGFLHVFPRIVVLLGLSIFSLEFLAQYTVAVCFVVAAMISALIVRPAYRWLIPSDMARWLICILLCLAPGLYEMLGNLPNLHYMLFMMAGIILLKDPAQKYSPAELAALSLTVLSTSLVVTLIPLAVFRCSVRWRLSRATATANNRFASGPWSDLLVVLMLLFPLFWSVFDILYNPGSSGIDARLVEWSLIDLFKGLMNAFVIYFVLFPVGGNITLNELVSYISPSVIFPPLLLVVGILLYKRWKKDNTLGVTFILWLAAVAAIPVMIFIARPNGFGFFLVDQQWHSFSWWMRYNYLIAAPGILFWFLLLGPDDLSRFKKKTTIFALILVSSMLFQAQHIFTIGRYMPKELWSEASKRLGESMRTGCPKSVLVQVYPGVWFTYNNRNSPERNCD